MCTVTWARDGGEYELFCNRDEKLTRLAEVPPRVLHRNGVQYLAPADGDSGGTWIAVNEFGLAFCLLNGYSAAALRMRNETRSRGELIPGLADASGAFEAMGRIRRTSLSAFAPFTLVVLEPGFPATLLVWDGLQTLLIPNGDAHLPLTSSSHDPAGVHEYRREEFLRLRRQTGRLHPRMLARFHASHRGSPDAYSTCMHRADAGTVSFTHVKVAGTSVQLQYTPSSPCQPAPGTMLALLRR